jgi:integrase
MPLKMVALNKHKDGYWFARKVIPADVKADYKRLHGRRSEAHFRSAVGAPRAEAVAQFTDWLSQVETTISTLRAVAKGEGQPLTKLDALALAGRWYGWFIGQYEADPGTPERWDQQADYFTWEVLHPHAPPEYHKDPKADQEWRWAKAPDVRAAVRPIVTELARVASFLASEGIALNGEAHGLLVDNVSDNLLAAFNTLEQRAKGDYSPDKVPESFPTYRPMGRCATNGMSIWALWEAYLAARKLADGSIIRWRPVFNHLRAAFPDTNADALTEDEARGWASKLITAERSARTVVDTWITAPRTVFSWGLKEKLVKLNPFIDIRPTVPRRVRNRETKAFTPEEARVILGAALGHTGTSAVERAKRWVVWLCAYSGSRAGEITQLRGVDVEKRGEIYVMKITPEAGSVKTHNAHAVPLHDHIIEQGFIQFVDSVGKGPLFYDARKDNAPVDPTNPKLSPAVRMRGKLGEWVRDLGVKDREVSPTHGWRHTFKQIANRVGISDRDSDGITDHAPPSEGRKYGQPTVEDMAAALKKYPRYDAEAAPVTITQAGGKGRGRRGAAKKRKR